MTREIIEDAKESIIPFIMGELRHYNVNGNGEVHAEQARKDLEEICCLAIKALEQEPRKGHWVIKDKMWWVCSACGCQTRMMKKYNVPNFCPACGADMREVEE